MQIGKEGILRWNPGVLQHSDNREKSAKMTEEKQPVSDIGGKTVVNRK